MSAVATLVVGRLVVAAICAATAGYLALKGLTGWGWFLFAAIWLGAISVSSSKEKVSE